MYTSVPASSVLLSGPSTSTAYIVNAFGRDDTNVVASVSTASFNRDFRVWPDLPMTPGRMRSPSSPIIRLSKTFLHSPFALKLVFTSPCRRPAGILEEALRGRRWLSAASRMCSSARSRRSSGVSPRRPSVPFPVPPVPPVLARPAGRLAVSLFVFTGVAIRLPLPHPNQPGHHRMCRHRRGDRLRRPFWRGGRDGSSGFSVSAIAAACACSTANRRLIAAYLPNLLESAAAGGRGQAVVIGPYRRGDFSQGERRIPQRNQSWFVAARRHARGPPGTARVPPPYRLS